MELKEKHQELITHKNYGERIDKFTLEMLRSLVKWCEENFVRIKIINKKVGSSYSVKEKFEKSKDGFYIKNADFKLAMNIAGFKSDIAKYEDELSALAENTVNLYYAISSKSSGLQ